jgi:hypothetical protein
LEELESKLSLVEEEKNQLGVENAGLRDAHLKELSEADDAVWDLGLVIAKLMQELGAAQSALLSSSGQAGEEEEGVARPSKSRADDELGIGKLLGRIDELGAELASAYDRAAQLSRGITDGLGRRVPEPELSVRYASGLRWRVYLFYFISLLLLAFWLFWPG